MRFFLSVLTRHRQNTDSRTWSILKTSSTCWKLRQRSFLSKHEFKLRLQHSHTSQWTRPRHPLSTFQRHLMRIRTESVVSQIPVPRTFTCFDSRDLVEGRCIVLCMSNIVQITICFFVFLTVTFLLTFSFFFTVSHRTRTFMSHCLTYVTINRMCRSISISQISQFSFSFNSLTGNARKLPLFSNKTTGTILTNKQQTPTPTK